MKRPDEEGEDDEEVEQEGEETKEMKMKKLWRKNYVKETEDEAKENEKLRKRK